MIHIDLSILKLQLLNDKPDTEDLEARQATNRQREFLDSVFDNIKQEQQQNPGSNSSLLERLGLNSSPPAPIPKKRPSEELEEVPPKRQNDGVSSSGSSKLCEKNKMLAMLLAKEPVNSPIPPIPAKVISAIPQENLPRVQPDPMLPKTLQNRLLLGNQLINKIRQPGIKFIYFR